MNSAPKKYNGEDMSEVQSSVLAPAMPATAPVFAATTINIDPARLEPSPAKTSHCRHKVSGVALGNTNVEEA
jgi:hypothetical protein